MRKADLHIHTDASDDATLRPAWVFSSARERGLAALAFADHDGMAHVHEGMLLSRQYGVEFLPGIEISSLWQDRVAHLLGYFPDGAASSLRVFLAERVWPERRRIELMLLERLAGRGVAITLAEYEAEVAANLAGTYHLPLCRLLCRKRVISSTKEYGALRSAGCPRYLYPSAPEVIQAIHDAGGIAVLAHPGASSDDFYHFKAEDIAALATESLDGIEVATPDHDAAQMSYYGAAADRLGLLRTGGSDTHHPHASEECGLGDRFCDWDEVRRYLQGQARPESNPA